MLTIVSGSIFDGKETYLCHQCNCITIRSKHLAKSVFARYPYADIYTHRQQPDTPGSLIVRGDGESKRFIVAIIAQYYPGKVKYPSSKRDGFDARLRYFKSCLKKMENLEGSFAFPWRIGCGAAGGNWDDYLAAIKDFAQKKDVTIYKLGPKIPVKAPSLFD